MPSLYSRLAAIKKSRSRPAAVPREIRTGRTSASDLSGFSEAGDGVFRRDERLPLSSEKNAELKRTAELLLKGGSYGRFVFFDTETTGLSGGAGTLAFLFAAAVLEEGGLRFVQLFLSDYPGEPHYLELLERELGGSSVLISYNGKTFDSAILRNRFVMNRRSFDLPPQLDLLRLARRVWRKVLPDCSLGTIEREILGRTRVDDLPGSLVPQVYFDFLAAGKSEDLPRVFEHNRLDVMTLIDLFGRIGRLIEDPYAAEGVDKAGLGFLAAEYNPPVGKEFLADLAGRGDRRALEAVSRGLKGRGAWEAAVELWSGLKDTNLYAGTELAKFLEHRLKDLSGALAVVEKLPSLALNSAESEALERRRARLLRKMEGRERSLPRS